MASITTRGEVHCMHRGEPRSAHTDSGSIESWLDRTSRFDFRRVREWASKAPLFRLIAGRENATRYDFLSYNPSFTVILTAENIIFNIMDDHVYVALNNFNVQYENHGRRWAVSILSFDPTEIHRVHPRSTCRRAVVM